MKYFFHQARNLNEERTQANIIARAETLFTDGYQMQNGNPFDVEILTPEGRIYTVTHPDPMTDKETCSCEAFAKYGDCKHRIAVAKKRDEEEMWETICAEYERTHEAPVC